jgi:hypothetical protein
MSAFRPISPVEFVCVIERSGERVLTDFPPGCPADARPFDWRRNIAARVLVRATIALSILTLGVSSWPISLAQSQSIGLSRKEIGAPPQKFAFWRAGQHDVVHWVIVDDLAGPGGAAIERSDKDRSVQNALAVYEEVSALNAKIRTHFKLIDGSTPSAGIALRVTAPDDYYLVRASEDEQRISLFRVARGVLEEIAGVDAEIARGHWQTLEVAARDNEFAIWLDDRWVLTVFDDSKMIAGQVGIWTERDDVTRFNQIEISPLSSDQGLFEPQSRPGG